MRKLILIFGVVLCLLAIGALCFNRVVVGVARWGLERQLMRTFGEAPTYRSLSYEGRTLRFEGLSCPRFEAEALEFEVQWPLHCRVLLERPTIQLDRRLPSTPRRQVLPITWEVEVVEGTFGDALSLEGRVRGGKGVPLEGALHSDDLNLVLAGERLELTMQGLQCRAYDELMALLLGRERPWQVRGGTIDGEVTLCMPPRAHPYLEGVAMLEGLELETSAGVRATLPLVRLMLQRDPCKPKSLRSDPWQQKLADGTVGTLRLLNPAQLTSAQWHVEDLTGGAVLHSDAMTLATAGELHFGEAHCSLEAVGRAAIASPGDLSLDLTWHSPSGVPTHSQIRLGEGEAWIDLVNLGSEHAALLQAFGGMVIPELAPLELSEGTLSASIRLKGRELILEHFEGKELTLLYPPKELVATCASAKGHLGGELRHGAAFHNLSGMLNIEEGFLRVGDGLLLEEVEASLQLKQGRMKRGEVHALCEGLRAVARRDPLVHRGKLMLELSGSIDNLAACMPNSLSAYMVPCFQGDHFELEVEIAPEGPSLLLEGSCEVDPAHLPFSARLRPQPLSKGKEHPLAQPMYLRPWAQLLLNLAGLRPSQHALLGAVVPHQFWLVEATLEGENLDASKYLAPVMLPSPNLTLNGTVDLIAHYDGEGIDLEMAGRAVKLTGPLFEIYVPAIGDLRTQAPVWRKAFQHTDLATGHKTLTLPIEGGHYLERCTGLNFSNTRCLVEMRDEHFEITRLSAEAEGVTFGGEIALRCPLDAPSDLILFAPQIDGKVEGVQRIMQRICPSFMWQQPIEGHVRSRGHGLDLHIVFGAQKPQVFATIEGEIAHGAWQPLSLPLEKTSMQMLYTHADRKLTLSQIEGQLELNGESLSFQEGEVILEGLPGRNCQFDLKLWDAEKIFAHLEGKLEGKELTLAPTTFFGGIQPNLRRCTLPDQLHAQPQLNPTTLARDAARLAPLLSLPLAPLLAQASSPLDFDIERAGDAWKIEANAEEFSVKMGVENRSWSVEQFRFGELVGSALAHVEENVCQVEELSLQRGEEAWHLAKLPPLTLAPGTLEARLPFQGLELALTVVDGNALQISAAGHDLPENPLTLRQTPEGLIAQGQICGLNVDLHTHSSSAMEGRVDFDLAANKELLPEGLNSFAERFRIGEGYTLAGLFSFEEKGLAFDGALSGRRASLLGYWWDQLDARLTFNPNHVTIESFQLNDRAGNLSINQIQSWRTSSDHWQFQVPLVRIGRLRPSLLRRTDGRPQRERAFTITGGEAHHIWGDSSGKESWTGLGSFTFTNPRRRDPTGTPFELPDQILGKLGLDPGNMIPSNGRITFHIHDGKMILSDFDEVYSRARRSQFFLADGAPSYVDLDGGLNLRIRTKQHNLLLKLTESLVIGVTGTLDNPSYNVQRAPKQRRDLVMGTD